MSDVEGRLALGADRRPCVVQSSSVASERYRRQLDDETRATTLR
jgi:hypothetical protein